MTSGKSAKLRMTLSAKAKTNGIDAQTLARLPLSTRTVSGRWTCPTPIMPSWTGWCAWRTG